MSNHAENSMNFSLNASGVIVQMAFKFTKRRFQMTDIWAERLAAMRAEIEFERAIREWMGE